MSLGDVYNNNENKKYQPTVYSPVSMGNPNSKVDATKISFSFWSNMLKISMVPKLPNSNDYDIKNPISVYLNHTNALKLEKEIIAFKLDPDACRLYGIECGNTNNKGVIYICNGSEFKSKNPCLVIKKITETGEVETSIAYEFKTDTHYGVRDYNEKTNSFEKFFYKDIEIDELQILLEQYYKAITGAFAYSVVNNMKYDMSRLNTKMDLVAGKLGIEMKKGNNRGSSAAFFNSNNSSGASDGGSSNEGFNQSTLDDIDGLMEI